jgi:hypothetical protein
MPLNILVALQKGFVKDIIKKEKWIPDDSAQLFPIYFCESPPVKTEGNEIAGNIHLISNWKTHSCHLNFPYWVS